MTDKTLRVDASTGLKGWDAKPFHEQDPSKVCATCRYAVKLRMSPQDIMGQVVCKLGPKHLTSLPQPGGTIGIAGNTAVRPDDWCFQHEPAEPDESLLPPLLRG